MNLSDSIAAYAADRVARGLSQNTRKNEVLTLRRFLAVVGNVSTKRLRPQHIDAFWASVQHLSPGSMNQARIVLSTFFKWCQIRGHIAKDMDLLEGQRKMKVPPRNRILIPQNEFSTFLGGIESPRDRAACAIGLYQFTRISDTSNLRWQDLDLEGATSEVYRPKTATLDTLPICEELQEELRRWKFEYGARIGEPVRPGMFVIPALKGVKGKGRPGVKGFVEFSEQGLLPMTRSTLSRSIRDVLVNAGYYQPYEGGHTLRRSGATALYNQLSSVGHDRAIRVCQAMLGHAHISTTEIYLRLDLDRKVRNDLLAGKPMFPEVVEATVLPLGRVVNGQEDTGDIRV